MDDPSGIARFDTATALREFEALTDLFGPDIVLPEQIIAGYRNDSFLSGEKALMVGLGMPLKDIFLHMLSKADDPGGGGHNMSEHFSSRALRVISPTACTGSQFLPAVGMARAIKEDGRDEVVYVSSGEGATSSPTRAQAVNAIEPPPR